MHGTYSDLLNVLLLAVISGEADTACWELTFTFLYHWSIEVSTETIVFIFY